MASIMARNLFTSLILAAVSRNGTSDSSLAAKSRTITFGPLVSITLGVLPRLQSLTLLRGLLCLSCSRWCVTGPRYCESLLSDMDSKMLEFLLLIPGCLHHSMINIFAYAGNPAREHDYRFPLLLR